MVPCLPDVIDGSPLTISRAIALKVSAVDDEDLALTIACQLSGPLGSLYYAHAKHIGRASAARYGDRYTAVEIDVKDRETRRLSFDEFEAEFGNLLFGREVPDARDDS